MRIFKKAAAALLAVLCVLAAFPLPAFADTQEGGQESYLGVRVADASTANLPTENDFGTGAADGRIWVDKTVEVSSQEGAAFDVTLSALAQEYISVKANVSSSGGQEAAMADVIFVLDMSSSMNAQDVTISTDTTDKYHRVEAMVRATNQAIKIIMDANPNNRVAVHWFGGAFSRKTNAAHVGTFMEMGSYTTTADEDYLRWGGTGTETSDEHYVWTSPDLKKGGEKYNGAHSSEANWGDTSPGGTAKQTTNGTPTQSGVTYAVQDAIAKLGTDEPSGVHQPYVFLLSDGAAITASSKWTETLANPSAASSYNTYNSTVNTFFNITNANSKTGSAEVAAATILGAAYQKEQLAKAYAPYSGGRETMFYVVGLGSDDAINGTETSRTHAWCGLNPGGLVKAYEYTVDGIVKKNTPDSDVAKAVRKQLYTYQNAQGKTGYINSNANGDIADPDDPGKFVYSNYYKYANTYPLLDEAFEQLSSDVAAATETVTLPVETESSGSSDGGGGGVVSFTDVIGAGMVAGVPSLNDITGTLDAESTDAKKVYSFEGMESVAVFETENGETTVTWNVAPSDMLSHMFRFKDAKDRSKGYNPADPIALSYSVSLSPSANPETALSYYASAFTKGSPNAARAYAGYTPTGDNPYYFYTNEYIGTVLLGLYFDTDKSLYVQGDMVGTVVAGATLSNLYITNAIAQNADGALGKGDIGTVVASYEVPADASDALLTAISESIYGCTAASGSGSHFGFLSGQALKGGDSHLGSAGKAENTSQTAPYSTSASLSNGKITALLGNNGRLDLKAGIAKAAASSSVNAGGSLGYTITVTNYAGEALTDITVSDPTPEGATGITNTTDSSVASFDSTSNTWTIASLEAGASAEITFTATIDGSTSETSIENTATITISGESTSSNTTSTSVSQGTDVTITIKKDGQTWTDSPHTLTLVPDGGDPETDAISDFSGLEDGTYTIYADGESTGKTITISDGQITGTTQLDYITVTVEAGTGCQSVSGGGVYLAGETVTIEAQMETGYGFDEWTPDPSGVSVPSTATGNFTVPSSGPVTLTANGSASTGTKYTVYHHVMDTSGVYILTKTQADLTGTTDATLTLADLKDTSLEVSGGIAYENGELGEGSTSGATTAITETTILGDGSRKISLYYERAKYSLTLEAGTGIGSVDPDAEAEYYYGEEIDISATVEDGYTFDEWDVGTGNAADNLADADAKYTMPASDATVTAKATPDEDTKYTVHHHVMDTSGEYILTKTQADLTGTTDATLTLADLKDTSLEVSGGIAYEEGELGEGSTSGATTPVTTATITGDGNLEISLYYERAKYSLTLEAGTGISSVTDIDDREYYYGEEIDISATVKDGYEFEKWAASTGTSDDVADRSTTYTMPAKDITLTAQGTAQDGITYTVYHHVMNTSGKYVQAGDPEEKSGVAEDSLTLANLVNADLEVEGGIAYKEGELGEGSEDGATSVVTTATIAGDGSLKISLYYERQKHKLTLEAGTGISVVSNITEQEFYYGEEIAIAATEKPGYGFDKWDAGTGDASDNVADRATTYTMPPKDITLTAKGKALPHEVIDPPSKDDPISLDEDMTIVMPGNIGNIDSIVIDDTEYVVDESTDEPGTLDVFRPDGSGPIGRVVVDDEGNINVVLNEEFLDELPEGEHKVAVVFDDDGETNTGEFEFVIDRTPRKPIEGIPTETGPAQDEAQDEGPGAWWDWSNGGNAPQTGDEGPSLLWLLVLLPAAALVVLCLVMIRRRKNQ